MGKAERIREAIAGRKDTRRGKKGRGKERARERPRRMIVMSRVNEEEEKEEEEDEEYVWRKRGRSPVNGRL